MDLPLETVQDYPRPPRLEPAGAVLRVILGGQEIIHTAEALRVLETHHAPTYYIPRSAISAGIAPAPGRSFCEWKGRARYWTLTAGDKTASRAAWDYPEPTPASAPRRSPRALMPMPWTPVSSATCRVTPQPGDFYWRLGHAHLRGIVKGGAGTEGW